MNLKLLKPFVNAHLGSKAVFASLLVAVAATLVTAAIPAQASPPNDPYFDQQWSLENTGQGEGYSVDADIDAFDAWKVSTGKATVVVAPIDTGIDYDHPELEEAIWTNPGEQGGNKNDGIDNDQNGFVDDWRGWDFGENDNDPMDDFFFGTGDSQFTGHGTLMAGLIGAKTDNGVGIAGLASHVRFMPLKITETQSPTVAAAKVADAIEYARNAGADIVTLNAEPDDDAASELVSKQIAASPQILFTVPAGNNGCNMDSTAGFSPCGSKTFYPCSYDQGLFPADNVVCTGASSYSDGFPGPYKDYQGLTQKSNYGEVSVDLVAPGLDLITPQSTYLGGGKPYRPASGTAPASSLTTGTAALMLSVNPALSPAQLRAILISTVDQIPKMETKSVAGGRLNAGKAVALAKQSVLWTGWKQKLPMPYHCTHREHCLPRHGG